MTTTIRCIASAAILCGALPAAAQDLPLPASARLTIEESETQGRYALPTERWSPSGLPVLVIEGPVTARAWRIPTTSLTPQQMILPLRDALEAIGWTILLDCAGPECGGFDFRYATRVLDGPAMYVDLTGYRFVSALSPAGAGMSLLTSHDGTNGYVQIIRAGTPEPPQAKPVPAEDALSAGTDTGPAPGSDAEPGAVAATDPAAAPPAPPATRQTARAAPVAPADRTGTATAVPATPGVATRVPAEAWIGDRLVKDGHAVLPGVSFASGSARLSDADVPSLDALAAWLGRSDARVAIVGHTDATGTLPGNRALSEERARSVLAYLVERHGLDPARLSAFGAGFLAPVASNLSDAGRRANRRVEAVILPD